MAYFPANSGIGGIKSTSSWLTALSSATSYIIVVGRGSNGTAYIEQSLVVPKASVGSGTVYYACGSGTAGYFLQVGLNNSAEPSSVSIKNNGVDMTSQTVTYYYD